MAKQEKFEDQIDGILGDGSEAKSTEAKTEEVKTSEESKTEEIKTSEEGKTEEVKIEEVKVEEAAPITLESVQEELKQYKLDAEKREVDLKAVSTDLKKKVDLYEPLLRKDTPKEKEVETKTPEVLGNERIEAFNKAIIINDDTMQDIVGGDLEKFSGRLRQFAMTIHDLTVKSAVNAVFTGINQHNETKKYNDQVIGDYYDKYPGHKEYPEFVTAIGNRIGQENLNKAPHELVKDIGDAVESRIKGIQTSVKPNGRIIRGEGVDIKPTTTPRVQLTELEKEMDDIIKN